MPLTTPSQLFNAIGDSRMEEIYDANNAKSTALRHALAATLLGLTGGAAAAVVPSIGSLFGASVRDTNRGTGTNVVQIPYPVYATKKDERSARRKFGLPIKTAVDEDRSYLQSLFWSRASNQIPDSAVPGLARHLRANEGGLLSSPLLHNQQPAPTGVGNWLAGNNARSTADVPWYVPVIGLGAVGGAGIGYGLTNYLLKTKRKKEIESEVEKYRRDYQKALLEQYNPADVQSAGTKVADSGSVGEKLGRELNALYTDLVKQGSLGAQAVGGAALLTALLGAGSGYVAYQYARKKSVSDMLEKAMKRRERERMQTRPPFVHAVPVPVKYVGDKLQPVDEMALGQE